jgi:hypothetical protein
VLQIFQENIYLTKISFVLDGFCGEATCSHINDPAYNRTNNSTYDSHGVLWYAIDDIDVAVSASCPSTEFAIDFSQTTALKRGDIQSILGYIILDKAGSSFEEVFYYSGELSFRNYFSNNEEFCATPFSGCSMGHKSFNVIIGSQLSGMSGSIVLNGFGISGMTSSTKLFEQSINYKMLNDLYPCRPIDTYCKRIREIVDRMVSWSNPH